MAELLEYALVILVSGLVASFSLTMGSDFSVAIAGAGDRAAYSSYVSAAYAALEDGRASASLSLSGATLYCASGTLGFDSPSLHASTALPAACDFQYSDLAGPHTLSFTYDSGGLDLEVG